MEFTEYAGEQDLKYALINEFSKACVTIFQSRHRVLVQIATGADYPIKLVTALFREFGRHIKKKVLFGILTGAEPLMSSEGERAAPFEFGLQLRDRLPFLKFQYVPYWDVQTFLGTTQDFAILDLTSQFNPDDIAIILEAVAGPGLIILITPPLEDWPLTVTRFVDQFNLSGDPLPPSQFITHFIDTAKNGNNILIVEENTNRLGVGQAIPGDPASIAKFLTPELEAKTIASLALTEDEREIFLRLKDWLKAAFGDPKSGHHFYLNSARGRGKTATLGLAVGALFTENSSSPKTSKKISLLITCPDLLQVQAAFQVLQNALSIAQVKFQVKKIGELLSEVSCPSGNLFYTTPGDVLERKRVDGIFIDEAGSIPVPILEKIAEMGLPCVWSTTTHGYEGIGRGFALKFLPSLAEKHGLVEASTMTTPIRYAAGDPIEKMLFESFFLDADIPDLPPQINFPGNLNLTRELFKPGAAEDRLRAIFGLLIQAHYKTKPSDFVPMLDVPSWQLWIYQTQEQSPIGAILATPEGGVTQDLADELASARHERQGLLVSWVIGLHHQAPHFIQQFHGLRIARIAVHPLLREEGYGSRMLSALEQAPQQTKIDFLSTSFGATPRLVNFWLKSGYVPIHIGLKRAQATGEYSLVMVKSLNSATRADIARFGADFKVKLVEWLRDVLYDADPATVLSIILFQDPTFEPELPVIAFSPSEVRRLHAYCEDVLKFKAASDVIRKVVIRYLYDMHADRPALETRALEILVAKLQSRSWKTIQVLARVPAQRAYGMVRESIKRLVKHYQI